MTRRITAATLAMLLLFPAAAYVQVSDTARSQTTETPPVTTTKDQKKAVPAAAVQRAAQPVAQENAVQEAPQSAIQSQAIQQPVQRTVPDSATRQPAPPPAQADTVRQIPAQAVQSPAVTIAPPATRETVEVPAVQMPAGSASSKLTTARQLMQAGDIAQATTVLQSARIQAANSGAKSEEASALFYLGVAQQSRIQNEGLDAAETTAARSAAITAYQQSLQVNPASGPSLNNLAQLYRTEPAKHAEADALLARAIELDDSHKGVYLLNRAALKRDAGDIPAALSFAEEAAGADRANLAAHRMVVDVALAGDNAGPLLAYLTELNSAGLVARALDTAASALQRFPADRAKLLLSIGNSLASSAYTAWPPRFVETDAGRIVQEFRDDQTIGTGVRELFTVLEQPVPAQSLRWWSRGYSEHERLAPDSPPAVMQNVMRRCAEIYRSRGDSGNVDRAERYYRMAIDLSGAGSDPAAFVGLAEMLSSSNRVDELAQLLDRYELPLLQSKGMAIAQSDFRSIFELRLALGMMYAYTKQWVNPQVRYKGAIWMLEHAEDSAHDYNRGLPAAEQIGLPPAAVRALSTGYAQTGNVNRSVTVRLDAAERYLASGQQESAADVLDEAWLRSVPANLDAALAQRLDEARSITRAPPRAPKP